MKLTVWQGYEQNGKRRFAASHKHELLKEIASQCSDVRVVREFHVWKSEVTVNSSWVHKAISAIGNEDVSGSNLLGRDYIKPIDSSRSKCYFALNKCIDDVPEKSIAADEDPATTAA